MKVTAGVLALQGACEAHRATFAELGVAAREVRRPADLNGLSHLVLPGGESTTIHHLLELFDLREPIIERYRAGELALFGTCAGGILLGRSDGQRPPRFGLLDATLTRNAYGRQVDSFSRVVRLEALDAEVRCVFIRAPKVASVGPGARVLAREGEDPILLEGPGLLAATFHPELSGDPVIHEYFLRQERHGPHPVPSPDLPSHPSGRGAPAPTGRPSAAKATPARRKPDHCVEVQPAVPALPPVPVAGEGG